MKVLGVRAEPAMLHWAVVEGTATAPILVAHDKAAAPVNLDEANALHWYRSRVQHLLQEYGVTAVAVRSAESFGRRGNTDADRKRARIEGVLLEVAASKSLPATASALKTIGGNLGTKSAKDYLDNDDLRGLDWSRLNANRREAVLVAAAALGGTKG